MTSLFAKSIAIAQLPHGTDMHNVQAGHVVINVTNIIEEQSKLRVAEFTRQITVIANDFSEQCARIVIKMCRDAIVGRQVRNAECKVIFPCSFAAVCDEKLFDSETQIMFEDCTIRMCVQRFITNQKTEIYTKK